MQWFPGDVTTAIQVSRKNLALLIVYITTDSEDGRIFDEFWTHIDTSNLLCPVVGIKLVAGETAAAQFADIYPTPIVPAAYLIDQNGKPLEVITTLVGKTFDQFRSKFDKATAQFINGFPKSENPVSQSNVNRLASAPAPVSVAIQPPNTSTSQEMTSELAEKVARAKALLEQKKLKDAEKKRESDKQMKEELTKAREAKQDRDDKALMEAAKQRKKEKMETEKEKERILAQIKADREDSKKRFGKTSNSSNDASKADSKENSVIGKAVPSDRCRLQVRLPDGFTFVEEFPSNDVLNSLVEIIRQKPFMSGTSFEIQQPYPRRVFSTDDYSKTFLENQLTPSCALVVVQKSSGSSGLRPGPLSVTTPSIPIFTWLLYPFTAVWAVVCSMFGWNPDSTKSDSKKSENGSSSSAGQASRRGMPRSAEVRRRGNVAGLENPNDDDPEERASFNGNSTQFM